jgi:quercetin dioxygenase-like cupin family protein
MRIVKWVVPVALFLGWLSQSADVALGEDKTAPPPKITILADEPVSGNDRMHAVIGISDWPVGGATKRHYHAGDEYAIVLEGAVEIDNDGKLPHIYKAGQAYHNKRGVVHIARNAYDGPSKLSFVLISDKGAPLQVPAP